MRSMAIFILAGLFTTHIYAQSSSSSPSADSILSKVNLALHSLTGIKYNNTRELNYASENYHNVSAWACYYDFQSRDTLTGFTYQIEDSASKQVFNGTEAFYLNKRSRAIQIDDHPAKHAFRSLSFLYNSVITLRNVLPLFIADKTAVKEVADTTISGIACILVTVNIGKRRVQNMGHGFDAMTTKCNFVYKIAIQKDNYLPFEVLQSNDLNTDYIKTSFTQVDVNPQAPVELSWYYSTYTNDYKQTAGTSVVQHLVPAGSSAPQWKLQVSNNDNTISLDDLKGKVVLLDFWIKNCGPCIQSVSYLNEMQNKLKDRNFKIVSINSYDSKSDVSWFCNKHSTNYSVLINGKAVAEKYGVSMFPTFFVVDKTGRIIYSGSGYDASVQSQVGKVIQKAM